MVVASVSGGMRAVTRTATFTVDNLCPSPSPTTTTAPLTIPTLYLYNSLRAAIPQTSISQAATHEQLSHLVHRRREYQRGRPDELQRCPPITENHPPSTATSRTGYFPTTASRATIVTTGRVFACSRDPKRHPERGCLGELA